MYFVFGRTDLKKNEVKFMFKILENVNLAKKRTLVMSGQ